jgi:hypothetical protein
LNEQSLKAEEKVENPLNRFFSLTQQTVEPPANATAQQILRGF